MNEAVSEAFDFILTIISLQKNRRQSLNQFSTICDTSVIYKQAHAMLKGDRKK